MRSRSIIGITAGVLALAALGATANAAGRHIRSHRLNTSALITELGGTATRATFVGVTKGVPVGAGVVRVDAKITPPTASSQVFSATETFEIFTRQGTVRGTAKSTTTPQPDGSFVYAGTVKVMNGTGRFKGAKGSGTLSGTQPPNETTFELTFKGSARY